MARSRRIRVVISSLEAFVDQILRAVVLDIVANLRKAPSEGGTPVDTGWARANWIPQIGQPFEGTAGSREKAEEGIIDQGPAKAGLAAVASTYTANQGTAHITNNVPYILPLNAGSSKQAPAGFVQTAIVKAIVQDLPAKFGRGR